MLEQYLKNFEDTDYWDLRVEEPYNYYGHRGRVDVVRYFTLSEPEGRFDVLSISELKTKIYNLNSELGKFKEYSEYFTKDFIKKLGITVDWFWNYLILLDTKENRQFVYEYWETFKVIFGGVRETFKLELQVTQTHPDRVVPVIRLNHLYFYDPIENKLSDVIFAKKYIENNKEVNFKEERLLNGQFYDVYDFIRRWDNLRIIL